MKLLSFLRSGFGNGQYARFQKAAAIVTCLHAQSYSLSVRLIKERIRTVQDTGILKVHSSSVELTYWKIQKLAVTYSDIIITKSLTILAFVKTKKSSYERSRTQQPFIRALMDHNINLDNPLLLYRFLRKYSVQPVQCWNCGTKNNSCLFCEKCSVLLESRKNENFFHILDMPQSYDVDVKTLSRNYHNLQVLLHPDKFSQKSEKERTISLDKSSLINYAFSILRDPLKRGLYLLELKHSRINENDTSDAKFLAKMMELYEQVEDTSEQTKLKQLFEDNQRRVQQLESAISKAFDKDSIDDAKKYLVKLKYYSNIGKQLKEKLDVE